MDDRIDGLPRLPERAIALGGLGLALPFILVFAAGYYLLLR